MRATKHLNWKDKVLAALERVAELWQRAFILFITIPALTRMLRTKQDVDAAERHLFKSDAHLRRAIYRTARRLAGLPRIPCPIEAFYRPPLKSPRHIRWLYLSHVHALQHARQLAIRMAHRWQRDNERRAKDKISDLRHAPAAATTTTIVESLDKSHTAQLAKAGAPHARAPPHPPGNPQPTTHRPGSAASDTAASRPITSYLSVLLRHCRVSPAQPAHTGPSAPAATIRQGLVNASPPTNPDPAQFMCGQKRQTRCRPHFGRSPNPLGTTIMKKSILSASLLTGMSLIVAAPAMAQATGNIGASYARLNGDTGTIEEDSNVLAIDGVVSFPVQSNLVLQVGGAYADVDGDLLETNVLDGSVHLGWKQADWAVGGYVGLSKNDTADLDTFWYGGEVVKYFNQFTLSGAVAIGSIDDADADLVGVGGEGRYFFNDNLRLDGRLGWEKIETSTSDADGLSFGIGGEWKPDGFPVSFTASYDTQNIDLGASDLDLGSLQVGVRFDFGAPTLKARDRSGPSFKTLGGTSPALGKVF